MNNLIRVPIVVSLACPEGLTEDEVREAVLSAMGAMGGIGRSDGLRLQLVGAELLPSHTALTPLLQAQDSEYGEEGGPLIVMRVQ